MSRKNANEYLSGIPLFAGCSAKELRAIGALCDQVDVPAGKVIVKQGSTGFECYVIVAGSAEVTINDRHVTTLGAGGYFGELAMLDKQVRSATVVASEASTLLVLGPRQFTKALETIPGLALKLMAGLATRLREANTVRFG